MAPPIELKDVPANDVRDFFVTALPKMANLTEFEKVIDGMYAFIPSGSAETTVAKAEEIVNAIRAHKFHGTAQDLINMVNTKTTVWNIPNHRVIERAPAMVHAAARKRRTRKQHGGQPEWVRRMLGVGVAGLVVAAGLFTDPPPGTPRPTLFSVLLAGSTIGGLFFGYLEKREQDRIVAEQQRARANIERAERERQDAEFEQAFGERYRRILNQLPNENMRRAAAFVLTFQMLGAETREQQFRQMNEALTNLEEENRRGQVELIAQMHRNQELAEGGNERIIDVPADTTNIYSYDTIVTGDSVIRLGSLVNGRMMYHYYKRDDGGLLTWWRQQDQRGEQRTNPITGLPITPAVEVLYGTARVEQAPANAAAPDHAGGRRTRRRLHRTRKARISRKN